MWIITPSRRARRSEPPSSLANTRSGPLGELMNEHLMTLAKYPPVQGGKSFDMSNAVEQFMSKGHD